MYAQHTLYLLAFLIMTGYSNNFEMTHPMSLPGKQALRGQKFTSSFLAVGAVVIDVVNYFLLVNGVLIILVIIVVLMVLATKVS